MKFLLLFLLINSVLSLSLVSGFLDAFHAGAIHSDAATKVMKAIGLGIGKFNNEFTFLKCSILKVVHPLFQFEDPKVNYLFFSQKNPQKPCDLQPTTKALERCKFNPKLETKVIVHGFIAHLPFSDKFFVMKDKFLQTRDYNVVVFNWTGYMEKKTDVSAVDYPPSTFTTFYIGLKLSSWIEFLQNKTGVDPKSFHFIGHSLGAIVSGITGRTICNLGKITYLDAAAPITRYSFILKPTYSDALYTEAFHTDAASNVIKGYGYKEPIAHIDFYPNGGKDQPQCQEGYDYDQEGGGVSTVNSSNTAIVCNHIASIFYTIASFDETCHFTGLICDNYSSFLNGACRRNNSPKCEMGIYAEMQPSLPVHSKCYMQTSEYYPYCLN